jgi:hypothetical protein
MNMKSFCSSPCVRYEACLVVSPDKFAKEVPCLQYREKDAHEKSIAKAWGERNGLGRALDIATDFSAGTR